MTRKRIAQEDLSYLETISNHAYDTLDEAVRNGNELLFRAATEEYENGLGNALRRIISPTQEIVNLRKGGKRTGGVLERYIFQWALMSNSIPIGRREDFPQLPIPLELTGYDKLKALIDSEEPEGSKAGVVFRDLQIEARSIRNAGEYATILKSMDYVRTKFPYQG